MTWETANINIVRDGMGAIQLCIKRLLDITLSGIGLLILSPLFLTIMLLIKLQNNGAVFFKQVRIGYAGKPFLIYKFRTMSAIIEENGPQLVAKCDKTNSTPLERCLRNSHLDELPQLWNVLRGEMSLVGPRPERKFFIDQIMEVDPNYEIIYQMRPGLTSEATLYNGYTDSMEKMLKRLEMDIAYYQRRSLLLDMKIVLKTALNMITGKRF